MDFNYSKELNDLAIQISETNDVKEFITDLGTIEQGTTLSLFKIGDVVTYDGLGFNDEIFKVRKATDTDIILGVIATVPKWNGKYFKCDIKLHGLIFEAYSETDISNGSMVDYDLDNDVVDGYNLPLIKTGSEFQVLDKDGKIYTCYKNTVNCGTGNGGGTGSGLEKFRMGFANGVWTVDESYPTTIDIPFADYQQTAVDLKVSDLQVGENLKNCPITFNGAPIVYNQATGYSTCRLNGAGNQYIEWSGKFNSPNTDFSQIDEITVKLSTTMSITTRPKLYSNPDYTPSLVGNGYIWDYDTKTFTILEDFYFTSYTDNFVNFEATTPDTINVPGYSYIGVIKPTSNSIKVNNGNLEVITQSPVSDTNKIATMNDVSGGGGSYTGGNGISIDSNNVIDAVTQSTVSNTNKIATMADLPPTPTEIPTYYVSYDGNDSNNGLTSSTPLKTLQKVVSLWQAAGNPKEINIQCTGMKGDPILTHQYVGNNVRFYDVKINFYGRAFFDINGNTSITFDNCNIMLYTDLSLGTTYDRTSMIYLITFGNVDIKSNNILTNGFTIYNGANLTPDSVLCNAMGLSCELYGFTITNYDKTGYGFVAPPVIYFRLRNTIDMKGGTLTFAADMTEFIRTASNDYYNAIWLFANSSIYSGITQPFNFDPVKDKGYIKGLWSDWSI